VNTYSGREILSLGPSSLIQGAIVWVIGIAFHEWYGLKLYTWEETFGKSAAIALLVGGAGLAISKFIEVIGLRWWKSHLIAIFAVGLLVAILTSNLQGLEDSPFRFQGIAYFSFLSIGSGLLSLMMRAFARRRPKMPIPTIKQ
jgi:hypothetical protein